MSENLLRDGNRITVAGGQSSTDSTAVLPFLINSVTGRVLMDSVAGSGSVTSVSVVSANGFGGTVATATTTPAITITTNLTQGSVPFVGSTSNFSQDNSNLFWNAASHILNINTAGDQTGTDAINTYYQYDSYLPNSSVGALTTSNWPAMSVSTSRGTGTSPTLSLTGDLIGGVGAYAYSGVSPAYNTHVALASYAIGATANNLGGEFRVYTKADNGNLTQNLTVSNAGAVTLNGLGASLSLSGASTGTTAIVAASTASGTLTLPAATDTLIGKATTDTLTNKTFNTAGTGNVFQINGTGITAVNGTGAVSLTTSPAFVTPSLGVATATSINGNIFTTGTYTLTGTAGKTLNFTNTLTLSGTDSTTMTFPTTTATIARTDAAQTFTGIQTIPQILSADNAIAASGNAATVTRSNRNNVVTNNSAATLTITMSTSGATGGDMLLVQIVDASAVAQTITWVNTENSTVSAPTTSNGSTTLPLTVGFKWNPLTSKWRCIASA